MYCAPIPEDDAARVATLRAYSILDTPPEQGYDDVTALATHICQTPFSTVTFVDQNRQWFKSEAGFGTNETGRAEGFCACAVLSPEMMVIEDASLDPRFRENPFVLGGPRIRFYAGAPLVAPNGHILGTVCVFDTKPRKLSSSQIAALRALARQVMALMGSRQRLIENEKAASALIQKEKLAAVGRLASSMAHEINNPLEAITNLLYLSRARAVDPELQGWLQQADVELRRVAVIANQTLRFHKQASKPRAITCLELLSATLTAYEGRLRNTGITVEKRKRTDEPFVCFEADVRHVLSNIVSNAIDAMPNGGRLLVRSRLGTNWRINQRGLILTVADTGTGMDQYTQRRIFQAFFSTKGIGGAGLGLWISGQIINGHHGQISLKSSQREGKTGTVVTIFLPFEISD